MAHKIKKGELVGVGFFYQLLGFFLCFTIIGAIIGIPLIIIGSRKAIVYKCSICMNKVDKRSAFCTLCKSDLLYTQL
jgi:hypothetical protein